MNDSFGARLRRERERQHITLAQIAAATKIKASLFEGLERDDVSRWPGGIFRRSFIRAYAEAIGLNADDVCREFTTRFPETADPALPTALDAVVRRTGAPPATVTATPALVAPAPVAPPPVAPPPLVAVDRFADDFADRYVAPPPPTPNRLEDEEEPSLRLTLADAGAPGGPAERPAIEATERQQASPPPRPPVTWQPLALDLGVLLIVALTAFIAFGAFWMPLALASLLYFLGGTAVLGRTAGAEFFALSTPTPTSRPVAPPAPPPVAAVDRALDMRDLMRAEPQDTVSDARVARPYTPIRQPVDIESRRARA